MREISDNPGNKREVIIEAAVLMFSQKGYHNTRMEEIAAAAGIGKGTIYEYFDSKLQLFQEMLEASFQLYYERLGAGKTQELKLEDRIRLTFEAHFNFCRDNRELTRVIFWDTEVIDPELKNWVLDIQKEKQSHMIELIEKAMEKGEIRRVDSQLVFLIISGVLSSVWAPITLDEWEINPKYLADQLTDLIMKGLRN
ncbi:MAG: TetR/AcrR family transcriptional regulator [Syntrophomonadaceae bacterium]|jgi:AcrR family transcriptional regulator